MKVTRDGVTIECLEGGLASVAFPAISTGAFGYPMEAAADVALRTVWQAAPHLATVSHVRFTLFGAHAMEAHT
ncbi:MAG: macro domain-containing protein, partial [Gemmatimonadota bacterium]